MFDGSRTRDACGDGPECRLSTFGFCLGMVGRSSAVPRQMPRERPSIRCVASLSGRRQHPDEVVATTVEGLQVAGCIADDIGRNLQQAHCAVAHLYQ